MSQKKLGIRSWNKGKKWSKEHRAKLSKIHKESPACQENVRNLIKFIKGKRLSPRTEFKKDHIPTNFKGIIRHYLGYIWVYSPHHPYADAKRNVLQHRLIVEKELKRFLFPWETVHHLNEIKDDNRPENLMAFDSKSAHVRFHNAPELVNDDEVIFDGRAK